MKQISFLIVLVTFGFASTCFGETSYHKTPMSDPKSFNGHFGDMDTSGDERVDWDEFKAHFSHAEPDVFKAMDLDKDSALDHDEWHAFKEAHGLRDHD